MVNADTEVIFPPRVIPELSDLPGEGWRELVAQVLAAGENSPQECAFVLMMARLSGCASCSADSFRAMRGCTQCARQSARRFKGTRDELNTSFTQALREVEDHWRAQSV